MSDTRAANNSFLVLGAGELGTAVLHALSERIDPDTGTTVTVLRRPLPDGEPTPSRRREAEDLRSMGIDILRADLASSSVEQLAAVFEPFGTVVSCTGFVAGSGTQRKLTSAVLQAGVQRYVPWQFGVDYDVVGRGSGQDVWDEQLDVRDMLRRQTRTHWIIVSTGMFTSFLFEPSFGVVDLARNTVHALGSWDNEVTVTTPDDIGQLTTAILFEEPRIVDEIVYVAGDTLSYSDVADAVDQVLGRTVERIGWTVADLKSDLAAHPTDNLCRYRLAFARNTGVAWNMDRTFNAKHGIPVTDARSWISQHLK